MDLLALLIGLAIGALLGYLFALRRRTPTQDTDLAMLQRVEALETENRSVREERSRIEGNLERAREVFRDMEEKLRNEQEQNRTLIADLSKATAQRAAIEEKLQVQQKEIEQLQQKFTLEFENIANRLLEEKSQRFTEQNRTNLDDILKPLSEKIKDFEKKVHDVYVNEARERASLKEQLGMLHQLNQQMSTEAQNLTRALKGESKTQGNWGEYILENILERSGLVKDREYVTQQSLTGEQGQRLRPDVIINLPDKKHLVIDSKVSIKAYEEYTRAEDETQKNAALREHLSSVRKHIRDLSEKNYQHLYGLQTLDFVLMFVPMEPVFALAVQHDPDIFSDAFDRNIVMVSPSTLLATLRTVASIWRHENQNRNAVEIARQGGALYDKFVGFVEDMDKIRRDIDSALRSHDSAMNKLKTGSGNLVRRAEEIRKLGAKASKQLPARWLDEELPEKGEE